MLRLEKRLEKSPFTNITVPFFSILFAFLVGAVFLTLGGYDPIKVYTMIFDGAFGSSYGISETLVKAIPLMLCSLGVAVAFKMKLWNIGAEGQFYVGAMFASYIALFYSDLPAYIMLPLMFIAGALGGALWAMLSAIPRALWKVNETITTLMLNYVAILWVDYLVYGPWKDPKGFNFPLTAPFTEAAILPSIPDTRVHTGLFIALVTAVIIYVIFNFTRWGFEIRVIGESPEAATYAGMNSKKNIIAVLALSGALAGIAGMTEVSGVIQRLQHGISPGYGYTAIIIAWLSKLHPAVIIVVSILFGALLVGGYSIQTLGISSSIVYMLQGAILFFILGGEIFNTHTLRFRRRRS